MIIYSTLFLNICNKKLKILLNFLNGLIFYSCSIIENYLSEARGKHINTEKKSLNSNLILNKINY